MTENASVPVTTAVAESATSETALMQVGTAGAAATDRLPTFNLPALYNPAEVAEVMQDNLGEMGGNLHFDKIKIPSGGGISFEVIDENGEVAATTELVGVVIDFYLVNAYWEHEYDGSNVPPDCSSMDAVTGTGNPEGTMPACQACANCPNNQWGSDPKGSKGKACKNMIRVYILQEGCVFPVLLTIPPTSMGNWKEYVKRLTGRMKSIYGIVTKVKLEKAKNEGGIAYSKAVFTKVDELRPDERQVIKASAAQMRSSMRSVSLDATEYNAEPPAGAESDTAEPY